MPPPTPGSPSPRKRRRKREDPQNCVTNSEEYDSDEASPSSYAEVERFQGKIVYNLDGKAYIIDSENELPLQLNDSSIKDVSQSNNPKIHSFRVISSRDATMNNSSSTPTPRITSPTTGSLQLQQQSDASARTTPTQDCQLSSNADDLKDPHHQAHSNHRQKPILMCFICKLSFGNAKLFSSHASTEHKLTLSESEKSLLFRECSSAIIQKNADEITQISFLEPLDASSRAMSMSSEAIEADNNSDNNNNSNNENDVTDTPAAAAALADESDDKLMDDHQLQHPRLTPKSLASLQNPITSAASVIQRLAGDLKFLNSQADLSQLTSLLEQHKTLNEFLSQQQQQSSRIACPEHVDSPNLNEIDCKSCEFLNINQMSPMRCASKSPMKGYATHESNASSKTSSPITSAVTPNSQQQQLQLAAHQMASSQNINTSPSVSSFTIGACPDHINGRPIGVDCARCEILLNTARLSSGSQISTRNSCKTLKCPQCNWHYKYQETLEIHMREKHPDGEMACAFCIQGAAHPRLARGESYTCGYKPYRCEICNYSTTTKGNLSIHMQSDKHLNNVQELNNSQSMNVPQQPPEIRPTPTQPSQPSMPSAPSTPQLPPQQQIKPKPKPSFRCEPCSYETPNARNYRIHETSEKHTHNLAVVQCNIKRLQSHMESFLKTHPAGINAAIGMPPGLDTQTGLPGNAGHLPGAALADLAYNQALLIQLLHQNSVGASPPAGFLPMLQQQQQQAAQNNQQQHYQQQQQQQQLNGTNNQDLDQGLNPDTLEPPFEQDFNPSYHFSCLICSNFSTNDLDELNNHINEDRSRLSFPQEFIVVVNNNNYTCRLCCYKTHLKANCQLHCKTDKHLQRVNFANHIKQGGLRNEYKFDYVINSTTNNNNYNITQLKCNCCDYYTNSIQKLNCHTQNVRHESMRAKFNHLSQLNKDVKMELDGQDVNISKALLCQLCNFKSNNLLDMIKHNKSLRHIQIEQIYCLQRRCESLENIELSEIYQLVDDINLESPHDFPKDDDKPAPSPASMPTPNPKEPEQLVPNPLAMLKMIPFDQLKALAANLPQSQTVLKCNHCDHLSETKHDMEQHFESVHASIECSSTALPSISALMAAAQMNFSQELGLPKDANKSDDLADKLLDDSDKKDTDIMTIEPDIDGVIINNSSRSSSAISMLQPDDSEDKSVHRATPQKKPSPSPFSTSSTVEEYSVMCPLCQDNFTERKPLEQHVMTVHSVNAEGLNRLLQLVDTSHWVNNKKSPSTAGPDYECLVCSDILKSMNDLLMHATDHQHFSITGHNQFSCLLKTCAQKFSNEAQVQQHFRSAHLNIVISERHVYKYRCPMCPLAFKTEEKLNNHFMYHTMRDATKCNICSRNFRSTTSLQRHVEQVHGTPTSQDHNKSTELTDDERMQTPNDDALSNDDENEFDERNSEQMPDAKRFKAIGRTEKVTSYSLEKYHDPNRPYKCEDCFESFTQPNILAVHKNSVSHLHRVKKKQGETHSGNSTPALGTSPNQMAEFDRRSVDFDRKSIDFEMEINNSMEGNKRKLSSDNDYDSPKKRFKCDICKVAYAQGSTLDIHMRSVGHQAKANRIMQQQQQIQQGPSATQSSSAQPQDLLSPQLPSNNGNISPKLPPNNQMYKALLENFGIDIVKQFNEINKLPQTPNKNNGNAAEAEKKDDSEAIDFSQQKSAAEELLANQMKLFNAEMMAQKQSAEQQKFDPAMLAQRLMEQQFLAQFPQFAQSLQNVNTGNIPMNTLDMLNLMQFHHFMSLNFMNLAPPLIFGGAQQGNVLSPGAQSANAVLAPPKPVTDVQLPTPGAPATPTSALTLLAAQQQQQQQSQLQQQQQQQQVKKNRKDFVVDPWNGINDDSSASFQACGNQKRARTRITDEQLKILRSHFDINNSPSEESIIEMSKKANLPQKVVKHWFRNTLFKERQRNKDSPYNFANPPSTTLNLEEYERTGQTKVLPLSGESQSQSAQSAANAMLTNIQQQQQKLAQEAQQKLQEQQHQFFQQQQQAFNLSQQGQQPYSDLRPVSQPSSTTSNERDDSYIKSEPNYDNDDNDKHNESGEFDMERFRQQQAQQQLNFFNNYETKSESGSSDILSRPQTPNSLYNNINDVISQQIESIPINNITSPGNLSQMGPPKKFQLNKIFDKSYESNSSSSNSSTSSGKRANRTRFTDYQIKVLQEFFENNSYPKDSDLEYLSKLLLLSPRVIVVWFQNARQKQRKIYENQPNPTNSPFENDEKKAGCINYTCKKCNLIFQRYYELIRHQKNHCFKEENNKKSAKAQIAAAQIAQSLSSEDSNSSLEINHASNLLGNNLLHPTPKSQLAQTSSMSTSTCTTNQNLPKLNLNHPVSLLTNNSTTSNNLMQQPLDFHQQSAPISQCHKPVQDNFAVEVQPLVLHQSFESQSNTTESRLPFFMSETDMNTTKNPPTDEKALYSAEKIQEFLLQKFSTQDFDLLTKNYDFFLQYYKTNCPAEQMIDEQHPSMDFLTQFYHLNEFKRKLNGSDLMMGDQDSNVSDDDGNDDVVALDDSKDESEGQNAGQMSDLMENKAKLMGMNSMHSNKRLRTTILPEQLNYLYECYQKESNPSRKQLEEIAKKVNLKKRVVQVWYQNSRARERKGQFRQNMQIINKKCPYCSAIFKVKSALESHLQTKHPEKQMINIDSIPEITFNPKDMNFPQLPQQLDLAMLNLPQNADFWKSALLQQPQTSQNFQLKRRSEMSESEISFTDSNNDEIADDDYDLDNFNDDSNHGDENPGGNALSDKEKSKRHRTHVNRVQKSILRKIFDDVKAPSMIDCENIGKEIGLIKRVVQVWFQNARANYKKLNKITTNDLKELPEKNPSDCMYCPEYVPSPTKSYSTHVLSQQHIQAIHSYVMKNESHDDDDDDVQEIDTAAAVAGSKCEQPRIEALMKDEASNLIPTGNGNFSYTNCHPQKSLMMVGDTNWID